MLKKILTVVDTFVIQGRGLVVLAQRTNDFEDFKVGDKIIIQVDGKRFIESSIIGLEHIKRQDPNNELVSFLVDSNVKKEDLPANASIWLNQPES